MIDIFYDYSIKINCYLKTNFAIYVCLQLITEFKPLHVTHRIASKAGRGTNSQDPQS